MRMILVPGYRNLFGEPEKNYYEYVKDIPSEIVIATMIALNNELNVNLSEKENQERLRGLISARFNKEQLKLLNIATEKYRRKTKGLFKGYFFGSRYLLSMVLKELNNYRSFKITDDSPQQEFNMLMAYFLLIDEVNDAGNVVFAEGKGKFNEPLGHYRLIWTTTIDQYELNEKPNVGFEFFKLLCFVGYAITTFRAESKEYVNQLGFKSYGELLYSIHQVTMTTVIQNTNTSFQKLNYIRPLDGVDEKHLQSQAINGLIGKREIVYGDLKKHSLYYNHHEKFMVIDEDIYRKRTYKGPFFDLFYSTHLRERMKFNQYSDNISSTVLEKKLFRSILTGLRNNKYNILFFNDESDSAPDCYYRQGKNIFLIEFKAYLFPDEISSNPNFEKIKGYIDKRFVSNEKGQAKGIGQVIKQMKLLYENNFGFDKTFKEELYKKKVTIYPIICHTEFYFSLPGINEYLNDIFLQEVPAELKEKFVIKPLTVIDLANLCDMALRGSNFRQLESFIDRYHRVLENRKKHASKFIDIDLFMKSRSSFDEMYDHPFQSDLPNEPNNTTLLDKLYNLMDIKQEHWDEVL
ncbi:MAG: hypothetical protein ABI675_14225 [Chitinophagaceae bacterium]